MIKNKNVVKSKFGAYMTKDYSIFKFIKGNRSISHKHVDELIRSFKKYGYLNPIVKVNEKMQIIDGQHTFFAAQAIGEWIYFIVVPGAKLPAVQGLNRYTKNWNADTFLESYVAQRKPAYIQYKEFKDKYGFNHKEVQHMLSGSQSGEVKYDFMEGKFKIADYAKAEKYAQWIKAVEPYYSKYNRSGFANAMLHCFENPDYDHSRFLHKLTLKPTSDVPALSDQPNIKMNLEMIEKIYNSWCNPKEKLYLRQL